MTNRILMTLAVSLALAIGLAAQPASASCSFNGLNGAWRGNDGGTYRVHQTGNRVWWTGMSGDNGRSWAHRFSGTRSGDIVTGRWVDFRGPMGKGTLTLRVRSPMNMVRVANTGSGIGGTVWRRGCNDVVLNPVNE